VLVWSLATSLRPPAPRTLEVLTAAHDLSPGTVLSADDLVLTHLPADAVPADASSSTSALVGRPTVVPLLSGEPVLARQVLSGSLLAGYGPDVVATPVRLSDEASLSVLRAGDLVDVLAARGGQDVGGAASATVVASRVRVLIAGSTRTTSSDAGLLGAPAADATSSATLVLATTTAQGLEIARAAVTSRLSVILRAA